MTTSRCPTPTAVIAREGGRSSIPEASVMESRSRGVLDTPLSRCNDGRTEQRKRSCNPDAVSPGQPAGLNPESIITIGSIDSGLALRPAGLHYRMLTPAARPMQMVRVKKNASNKDSRRLRGEPYFVRGSVGHRRDVCGTAWQLAPPRRCAVHSCRVPDSGMAFDRRAGRPFGVLRCRS